MYKKGGNRWCTQMWEILREVKKRSPANRARICVIIGDNCAENKNNINFAFVSEVVMAGWYDEVMLLFGPVGHTHNGIDANHRIHNRVLGRFVCPTLADMVLKYPIAWRDGDKRPTASLFLSQYDWCKHYSKVTDTISGFTKTAANGASAKAFRFARSSSSGMV
jgi:hypothetical protein